MAPKLTKAVKEELSERALAMNCKGKSFTSISEELEVNWKTAKGLVRYALDKRDIDEDAERQRSLAHHREIVRWCWEQLEGEELKTNAQNRPAYIARIQHSISEIDRLNGVREPEGRLQVNVNVDARQEKPDYSNLSVEEQREYVAHLRKLRGETASNTGGDRPRAFPSRN